MSRSTPYQSKPSVDWLQAYATLSNTRLYLIARNGPTVFKINDEEDRSFKVVLGNPISCTCSQGSSGSCIHILYCVLKVLRVTKEHPLAYQTSFTDAELTQILSGQCSTVGRRNPNPVRVRRPSQDPSVAEAESSTSTELEEGLVKRQALSEVEDENLCPICQDEMDMNKQALTWCRRKCGNNMHAKCMLIFAQHKQSSNKDVECPLCREPYDMEALQRDNKSNKNVVIVRCAPVTCSFCKCLQRRLFHRCVECSQRAYAQQQGDKFVDFCGECFTTGRLNERHREHHFLTSDASIENANEVSWATAKNPLSRSHPTIDARTLQTMQQRDLTVQDYDLLLSLDRKDGGDLSVVLVASLPLVSEAMIASSPAQYGKKCVCSAAEDPGDGETIYCQLPCQHIMHKKCLKTEIETVLLDDISNLCKYRCTHDQCGKVVFVCLKRKLNRPKKEGEGKNSPVPNGSTVSTSQSSGISSLSTALRNQAQGNSSVLMGLGIAGTGVEGLSVASSVSVSTSGRVRNLNAEPMSQAPVPSIPQPRRLLGANSTGIVNNGSGSGQPPRRFSEDTSGFTRPPAGLNLASDRVNNVGRQLANMVQQEMQGGISVGGVGIAGTSNFVEAEFSVVSTGRGSKAVSGKRAPAGIGRLRSLTANSAPRDTDVTTALGVDSTPLVVGRAQSSSSNTAASAAESGAGNDITSLRLTRSSSGRSGLGQTGNQSDPMIHSSRSIRSNNPSNMTPDLDLAVGNVSGASLLGTNAPLPRSTSRTKAAGGNIIRSTVSRPKRNTTGASQDNIAEAELDALLNVHHY